MRKVFQFIVILFLISMNVEAQVINAGIGGNTSAQLLARIDNDVICHKPDLVIVMVGTNDMLNSKKMASYKTYASNLSEIVRKLKQNSAQVILMAPPPVDSVFLFERHNRKLFHQTPNEKLDSVRQIITRIAKKEQIGYIDIYQKFLNFNLPQHNEDLFIMNPQNSGYRDGVHPTALGYHFIAENVFQYLQKNILLKKGDKIICFGDSITKGSKVKGSGTAEGETYPAYLKQLLEKYLNHEK